MTSFRCDHHYLTSPEMLLALLLDEEFLTVRSRRFGAVSPPAVTRDGTRARVVTYRKLPMEHIPPAAKPFLPPDGQLKQTDDWELAAQDPIEGMFRVQAAGVPADLSGHYLITRAPGGCRHTVEGSSEVRVPVLGPVLEPVVSEQLVILIGREQEFAETWLSGREV